MKVIHTSEDVELIILGRISSPRALISNLFLINHQGGSDDFISQKSTSGGVA
jgi:hypothetical protein